MSSAEEILVKVDVPQLQRSLTLRCKKSDTVGALLHQILNKEACFRGAPTNQYGIFDVRMIADPTVEGKPGWLSNETSFTELNVKNNAVFMFKRKIETLGGTPLVETFDPADGPLFGAPLEKATVLGNKRNLPYPIICEKVLQKTSFFLETEGLFRLSGAASKINEFKNRFDNGEDVDMFECNDPHVLSGLLKQYLRELPDPLLTHSRYEAFIACLAVPDGAERTRCIRAVVHSLPNCNFHLLKRLMAFLLEVSKYSETNKMAKENLATVFGPNIMSKKTGNVMDMVRDTAPINAITCHLIDHYADIFPEPDEGGEPLIYECVARVLYRYVSQSEGELSVSPGDSVFVVDRSGNDGWWEGSVKGKRGLVPHSYLEVFAELRRTVTIGAPPPKKSNNASLQESSASEDSEEEDNDAPAKPPKNYSAAEISLMDTLKADNARLLAENQKASTALIQLLENYEKLKQRVELAERENARLGRLLASK